MFGDPYFGLMIKHYMFDQNGYVLKDVITDMAYQQIALFLPQIKVARKDVEVVQDREKGKLYCNFRGINQIDYQVNTYSLVMFDERDM